MSLECDHIHVLLVEEKLAWVVYGAVRYVHDVARLRPRGFDHVAEKLHSIALVARLDNVGNCDTDHLLLLLDDGRWVLSSIVHRPSSIAPSFSPRA